MRWGVLRTINERTDKIGMWMWKWVWVWVWMEMGMGQDRMDKMGWMGCDGFQGWREEMKLVTTTSQVVKKKIYNKLDGDVVIVS